MNKMKKILVYGDSNTWGDNFITRTRSKSWVDLLKETMKDYEFITEGLPGRVAGSFLEEKSYKNGKDTFLSIFLSSSPVDIVIIALGSNDLQNKYNRSSGEIINDLLWYEETINNLVEDVDNHNRYFYSNFVPKFIYILPTNFEFSDEILGRKSEIKRKDIIKYFKNSSKLFIEANDISLIDGLHYSEIGHIQMAELVKDILSKE